MGLFAGKKGIIMGVANERSIATGVARFLHEQGATLGFSHLPDSGDRKRNEDRLRQIAETMHAKLIAPCDVGNDDDIQNFFSKVKETFGSIDFLVHSIAFAPVEDIRCATIDASRNGFKTAMDISVYSFIATARAAAPLMTNGGSICAMSYFGGEKVVMGYNLMGVCKAALESSIQYLAFDLGPKNIRVNGVSAGPLKTLAASAVGDFKDMMGLYEQNAPLGRNVTLEEVAKSTGYLLSDLATATTGEILHVDGGYHVMGGPGHKAAPKD